MEAEQLANLLARNKRFITLVIGSAAITALALTYVVSEKYRASTLVLIRPQQSVDLVPKRQEILNFPVGFYTPVETGSKTYTEIVKSRAIAEKIVGSLHLDKARDQGGGILWLWRQSTTAVKKAFAKIWVVLKFGRIPQDTPFNEAVEETIKNLEVKPTKDTYLFEIQATSRSPHDAADIANAATSAFMEYMVEASSTDRAGTARQSEERLAASEWSLAASRKALADYKRDHGLVSLSKETEVEVEALSSLQTSLQSTTTKIAGLLARHAELERKLGKTDKVALSSTKRVANPILADLRAQLANDEVKLARLNKLYTPKHKEVEELTAEIQQIEEVLNHAPATLESEQITQVTPQYQWVLDEITRVDTDLASLRAEQSRLNSAVEEKRSKLARIPSEEAEVARLQLAVGVNEEAHKIIAKANEEISVFSLQAAPSIEVVQAAVPSVYPVSPIKIYNVSLAALLGLLLAIALVLASDYVRSWRMMPATAKAKTTGL